MGEAWLEASETEIHKRQEKDGNKISVVIAFAIETIFIVLPQAYKLSHQQKSNSSPNNFVPQKNKTIAKIVNFFKIWLILHIVGMSVAFHIVMASIYPKTCDLLLYWVGFLAIIGVINCKRLWGWWIKNEKPVISVVGGGFVGFYSTLLLVLSILLPMQIQASLADFAAYEEWRKQMGHDTQNPSNQWFEEVKGEIRLRSEHKKLWCSLSRARLEGASASLQLGQQNQMRGIFLSQLYFDTYYNGCWDNEEVYITHRRSLATKSISESTNERVFNTIVNLLFFEEFKNSQNYMRTKNLYSAHTYCMEYTVKTYKSTAKANLNNEFLTKVCHGFTEEKSMTIDQAPAIRSHSNQYIHALEEQ